MNLSITTTHWKVNDRFVELLCKVELAKGRMFAGVSGSTNPETGDGLSCTVSKLEDGSNLLVYTEIKSHRTSLLSSMFLTAMRMSVEKHGEQL